MSNWNFSTEIPLSRVRSSGLCALRVAREKLPSGFASSRIFRLARLTLRFLTCKCRASSPCSPVGDTAYASNRANSRREGASYLFSLISSAVFFFLDPHPSKCRMNLICCTSMLKARTRGQFARTCALSALFCRLSSRACASAVFEKQPSPLHLFLAIC